MCNIGAWRGVAPPPSIPWRSALRRRFAFALAGSLDTLVFAPSMAHGKRRRPAPWELGFIRGAGAGPTAPCSPAERGRCSSWIVALALTNLWSQRKWLGFLASLS